MVSGLATVQRFLAAMVLAIGLSWAQPVVQASDTNRPRVSLTTTDDDNAHRQHVNEPRFVLPPPATGMTWRMPVHTPSMRGIRAPHASERARGDPAVSSSMAHFRAGTLWFPNPRARA